jgi:hypothetical protein
MTFFGRFRRRHTPAQAHRTPREVDVSERARQEAWGPITDETREEDRRRIAKQKAKDFGLGQLV